jgi:hypothetical protein
MRARRGFAAGSALAFPRVMTLQRQRCHHRGLKAALRVAGVAVLGIGLGGGFDALAFDLGSDGGELADMAPAPDFTEPPPPYWGDTPSQSRGCGWGPLAPPAFEEA